MANRLADELSPYLLQHAANPVDWYPWGPEALERARSENKPIFLSIGYSACHWCHVMEHESFEDVEIARQLNADFIPIKVDREERPDLDQVYMNAVQTMTGHGGWPMSVFLTPELKPFYGGTYWPRESRMGMPGFDQVLSAVADAWRSRREQAIEQAAALTEHLQTAAELPAGQGGLAPELVKQAATTLSRVFDHQHGGFGRAPKFPHPMDLRLLLRVWRRDGRSEALEMVKLTLDKMAAGGIYDQLGGGFHRYSVDERWLVPHFEKMLYDNALLATAYLDSYLATRTPRHAEVAREICDYVLREMTDPAGGFYSTQDADSEGVEGKFFVWTLPEVASILGDEKAHTFSYVYDVSEHGNFEEHNILNLPKTISQAAAILNRDQGDLERELAESRAKLLAARERRVHPALDDKVLVSWNGLMIDALAQAAGVLDEPRYAEAAAKAARFLLVNLTRDDGRLLHVWRGGVSKVEAYLDDYACLANALISLYEADFDVAWIDEAVRLVEAMLDLFSDRQGGGFFYTAHDHEQLITRQKDFFDAAVPSGNAMAATCLVRLGRLTGDKRYLEAADETLSAAAALMKQSPTAAGQMLLALDMYLGSKEIVIVGDRTSPDTRAVLRAIHERFLPNALLALRPAKGSADTALAELFRGKEPIGSSPTVYICESFACQAPAAGRDAALAAIEKLAAEGPSSGSRLPRADAGRQ